MGRASVKENKTPYQISREAQGLSREKASDMLEWIAPERIEKIESGKSPARPEEVVAMARVYKNANLCNYYCANDCEIGKTYVPEIQIKDLSRIVLEMVASLNAMHKRQERLIEITADGEITQDEIADFVQIQDALEKISVTVETLRLWSEQMLVTGKIDRTLYDQERKP